MAFQPATPTDVETRLLRPLSTEETQAVTLWLADAEDEIRTLVPDLDAKIDAGTLRNSAVARVQANMVVRLVRNPEGIVQESDGDYSYTRRAALVTGELALTRSERRSLGLSSGAFTIQLGIPGVV